MGGVGGEKNDIFKKKFLFKFFYSKFNSTNALNLLFITNALSIIYSNVIYFVDKHITENGFCGMR